MNKVTQFFMQRTTLFWSLMVGILLLGVISYIQMPKLEDPAVPVKQASVVLVYPGADVHTMELEVVQPMEDALRTLPDIRRLKTEIHPGQAIIGVELMLETPMEELEQHFDMIRRKASDLAPKLPQGCYEPVVIDDMMDVYGLFYAFTGDGYSYDEMLRYAKLLRQQLLTVNGVKRVNIGATRSEVFNIQLTPDQLKRNGLIPTEIMMALQGANSTVNAGVLEAADDRISMTIDRSAMTEDDLRQLLIDTPDGKKIKLGDLATVTREYVTPHRNALLVNGNMALSITISLDNDAIVPDVGKAVDAKLAEVMADFPAGMEMEKIFFQPDKVSDAVEGFMINLLESVLIVIVVLMFTMGWRAGIIIGFGLVLTVALSFPILNHLGTTLQRISLGAFIVAMGMLVDNAVVIMDGILVDRKRRLPYPDYLYRIGRNTAMPLLGATVIAACTFLPIYLTPGSAGEFAGDLFLVICVSLLVSWFLALIQVPVCANAWLPRVDKDSDKEGKDPLDGRFYNWVKKLLMWLIGHKTVSLIAAFLILVCAAMGMKKVRQVFFPDFDYKQFVVECYFPPKSSPDYVLERMQELADSALAFDRVDRVVLYTGGAPARYCFVRPMPSGGDNYGELIVDCKDFKTMQEVNNLLREHLREIEPDAYIRTRKYNFSISSTHTVEVEFTGPDPAVLRQLAAQACDIMRSCPYVDTYSVQDNWQPRTPGLSYNYSQAHGSRAGVSRSDVANALQATADGYSVGVIYDGDKMLPVNLIVRNNDGSRLADPGTAPVWSMSNVNIDPSLLQGLATGATSATDLSKTMFRTTIVDNVVDSISLKWDEGFITRFNGQRAIQAECDPNWRIHDATPAKVIEAIAPEIEAIPVPPGYTMRWVGEQDTSKEASAKVYSFMPFVLIIIFAILLMLFNDWRKLFVILISFPFVLCGIVPLLLLTDTPFTFLAILGFEGLIGMMVKNAIVLVDEITRLTDEEGMKAYDAVIRATLSRVRPVCLASVTTIVGMIPLVSDPMYGSLAATVIGGLAVGTIVTLMLLPLFYSVLFRIKPVKK